MAEGSSPVRVAFYCTVGTLVYLCQRPGWFWDRRGMFCPHLICEFMWKQKFCRKQCWWLCARQSLLGACWLWYHPQQVAGELLKDNVSKRSDCLYMAFCKCREPLTLMPSTNFGYAIESQLQASVVIYPRSISAPCSGYRNFHHVWFMGVTFESLWVESTIELWDTIFVGEKKSLLELI